MLLKSNHIDSVISNIYETGFAPKENAKGYEYYAYMQGKRVEVNPYPFDGKVNRNSSIEADTLLEKVHSAYFLSKGSNDLIFPLGSNAYGISVEDYISYDNMAGNKPQGIFGNGNYITAINDGSKMSYPYTVGGNEYYKEFPYSYKGVSSFCNKNDNLIVLSLSSNSSNPALKIEKIENSRMFISDSIYELKKDLSRVKTSDYVSAELGSANLEAGDYVLSFFYKTKKDFNVQISGITPTHTSDVIPSGCYERYVVCFTVDSASSVDFKIEYVGPIRVAGILLEETDKNMPSPYYKAYHDAAENSIPEELGKNSPLAFSNPKKQEGTITVVNFKRELDDSVPSFEAKELICGFKVSTPNPEKFENVFAVVGNDIFTLYRFNALGELIEGEVSIDPIENPIKVLSKDNREYDVDIILGGHTLDNSHPGYYRDLIIYNSLTSISEDMIKASFNSLFEAVIIDGRDGKRAAAIKSPLIYEEGING